MDSGIISGLIGGILSVFICSYISKRVRSSSVDGKLKFGTWMVVLAWSCLAFSGFTFVMFFIDNDVWVKRSELISVIGLFVGFGIAAIYCFGEYFKVCGKFDEVSIIFHTPWTGSKNEKWENLESIKFNSVANWYVLAFDSGSKIRLSSMLSGYGEVLDIVHQRGYDF